MERAIFVMQNSVTIILPSRYHLEKMEKKKNYRKARALKIQQKLMMQKIYWSLVLVGCITLHILPEVSAWKFGSKPSISEENPPAYTEQPNEPPPILAVLILNLQIHGKPLHQYTVDVTHPQQLQLHKQDNGDEYHQMTINITDNVFRERFIEHKHKHNSCEFELILPNRNGEQLEERVGEVKSFTAIQNTQNTQNSFHIVLKLAKSNDPRVLIALNRKIVRLIIVKMKATIYDQSESIPKAIIPYTIYEEEPQNPIDWENHHVDVHMGRHDFIHDATFVLYLTNLNGKELDRISGEATDFQPVGHMQCTRRLKLQFPLKAVLIIKAPSYQGHSPIVELYGNTFNCVNENKCHVHFTEKDEFFKETVPNISIEFELIRRNANGPELDHRFGRTTVTLGKGTTNTFNAALELTAYSEKKSLKGVLIIKVPPAFGCNLESTVPIVFEILVNLLQFKNQNIYLVDFTDTAKNESLKKGILNKPDSYPCQIILPKGSALCERKGEVGGFTLVENTEYTFRAKLHSIYNDLIKL